MKLPWRKEDWDHYEFTRARWPDGITSWTYKRSKNPFMWAVFGNDRDGCTPWVHEKQWSWARWWLRNRFANWGNCIVGLAIWEEGVVGDNAWATSPTLERKFWIGVDAENTCVSWVRDSARGHTWWRPYVRLNLPFNLFFHAGWKPTKGHLTAALKKRG